MDVVPRPWVSAPGASSLEILPLGRIKDNPHNEQSKAAYQASPQH
jgi:hypothetical protein